MNKQPYGETRALQIDKTNDDDAELRASKRGGRGGAGRGEEPGSWRHKEYFFSRDCEERRLRPAGMARRVLLMMCAAMLGSADAFTVARPALSARAVASTASPALLPRAALRSAPPAMGLFGLGWAELGVIGILALFIFGPDKIVPFARDLGKQSVALKVRHCSTCLANFIRASPACDKRIQCECSGSRCSS